MGTWRTPKGSYFRSTGDFFIDRAATVGGYYRPSATRATTIDLYNNAQDGSTLHVYRVWVGNDASAEYGMTKLFGHGANFLQNAVPVVTGNPTLPGQAYWDTIPPQYVPTFSPTDTPLSDAFIADNEAGSQDAWATPGPICVLPPGYSMRAYSFIGSNQVGGGNVLAVTFYFLAMPDRG